MHRLRNKIKRELLWWSWTIDFFGTVVYFSQSNFKSWHVRYMTNSNMDHLLHMFHHGQVYFRILTIRFDRCLWYCGTSSTHDFSSNSNSLSSLSLIHLSHIYFSFFICIFSLFQIFLTSSSTYSSSSFFMRGRKKTQEIKKLKLHN